MQKVVSSRDSVRRGGRDVTSVAVDAEGTAQLLTLCMLLGVHKLSVLLLEEAKLG